MSLSSPIEATLVQQSSVERELQSMVHQQRQRIAWVQDRCKNNNHLLVEAGCVFVGKKTSVLFLVKNDVWFDEKSQLELRNFWKMEGMCWDMPIIRIPGFPKVRSQCKELIDPGT